MKDEPRLAVKLPADLLAEVHAKAHDRGTTVSDLVRKFFLVYVSTNWESSAELDTNNPIYNHQENAKRKRKLKENIRQTYIDYKDARDSIDERSTKLDKDHLSCTKFKWHNAVEDYNAFCASCREK